MLKRLTIKDHRQESKLFNRRCFIAMLLILLFAGILVLRLVYLQITEHRFYSTLSQHNILSIIPIQPNRGLIYDRNGILVAKNVPVFSLDITAGDVENIPKTIKQLQKFIRITPSEVQVFFHSLKQYRQYQPVPLKFNLTPLEIARFYVNEYRFPGVTIQSRMMRYYPLGKTMSNVVGYVGRINAEELRNVDPENYSASSYIGKVGIEKYYENILHGKVGAEEVEINASGHVLRILKYIPPTPGQDIYLTVDSKLQAFAEKALGKNSGSIVAIQPSTGQILALVTKPDYNPNQFVKGLSKQAYQKLLNSPQHPLYNRAIRGLYSPGSTIKPFYALGALDAGIVDPQYTIYDPGWFRLPNTKHIYHGWKHTGHGWVNITKAIIVSCDIFFYNLAVDTGITRMDHLLKRFGFGQLTGVDMTEELPGIVPSPEWKLATQHKPWYTGDTVITGIGQGSLLVTPLQLATATATLSMHGIRLQPHLLLATKSANGVTTPEPPLLEQPVVLKHPNVWNIVIQAMEKVVTSPYGTAIEYGRHPGYTVAAKTGTAQVYGDYRNEELSRTGIPKRLRDNHLFISFAPVKDPKIAMAVVVEHAAYADRIAREVTDFYFKELATQKKRRLG